MNTQTSPVTFDFCLQVSGWGAKTYEAPNQHQAIRMACEDTGVPAFAVVVVDVRRVVR